MARTSRRSRPEMDGLEGRLLLNARMAKPSVDGLVGASAVSGGLINGVPIADRFIGYVTARGAHVVVNVAGNGSLAGTSVTSRGSLNLVYSGTNAASKIYINVRGGTARLLSVRAAALPIDNATGIGGQLLGSLLAPSVDLADGGKINLSSGIGRLQLHSIGRNTQIHLRELPQTVQSSSTGIGTGATSGFGGATGGGSLNGTPARTAIIPGAQAVAASLPASPIAPTTYAFAGRTLSYSNDANGGSTLTGVSGLFAPTPNLVVTPDPTNPSPAPAPPGILIQVNQINAGVPGQTTLGTGELFGFDPVMNALVRFDAHTGAALGTIPVGASPTALFTVGVGLGRNGREQVVLLGRNQLVQAFDVVTGAPVGQFSTADLAGLGINMISGIGANSTTTVVSDFESGTIVPIDVTASLASGHAVAAGAAFTPAREFLGSGVVAGVPTSNNFYELGAAHFDPSTPDVNQVGVITASLGGFPREVARTALTNQGAFISSGAGRPSTQALGSLENLLALDTGVANSQNVVALYNPSGLTPQGTINLADPNLLAGLSGTFHPEVAGSALIDVQGNIQSFNATTVHGLALNDAGNLNLLNIRSATDSTIVGQPVGHIGLLQRHNVVIVSSARVVGTRLGVIVDPTVRPLGPVSLPG